MNSEEEDAYISPKHIRDLMLICEQVRSEYSILGQACGLTHEEITTIELDSQSIGIGSWMKLAMVLDHMTRKMCSYKTLRRALHDTGRINCASKVASFVNNDFRLQDESLEIKSRWSVNVPLEVLLDESRHCRSKWFIVGILSGLEFSQLRAVH